jgi:tRNA(Ile)-lysidine synthase
MLKPFILAVLATIKKHSMLYSGDGILVGLSGGPDSVCLLYTLNQLKPMFSLRLNALYIDHRMRPSETEEEISFCARLCRELAVPFTSKSVDVKGHAKEHGMNVQEAARNLRYRLLEEHAHECDAVRIALGHTADDQAETVLMRLLRGSGPTGLGGMPPCRGTVIRPLIETTREQIEKFLKEEEASFVIDSSNAKKDYFRNSIRLGLLPEIKRVNPDIVNTLTRMAEIFRDEERYFDILVTKSLMKMISRKKENKVELFLSPLEAMDKVIMRRVLRRIIDETRGLREISFSHIEAIMDLIRNGQSGARIYLPGGIRIIKDYSTLIMTSEPPLVLAASTLSVPGETHLKEAGMLVKAGILDRSGDLLEGTARDTVFLDADRLSFPLIVRHREKGDFFYPAGFGKRKKLQDFFVDEKVPRDERDRTPLLVSGEEIACVLGLRCDERFKVGEETKKVLKLELKKARD